MGFKMQKLWAYVSVGPDGDEGLIGAYTPSGWLPFVCADEARVEQLRHLAKEIAAATRQTVRLISFETRVEHEIIEP